MESPLDVLTRAATMIEANQLNQINGKASFVYFSEYRSHLREYFSVKGRHYFEPNSACMFANTFF